MTRDSVIDYTLDLAKSHNYLILNWATGVGKTRGAISIASLVTTPRILLIVAEIAHKENWREEFNKWNKELWEYTTVECYASLKNYRDTEWDIIILDEGHHAVSKIRADILSTLKAKKVIVLTATLSFENEFILSSIFKAAFYKYTITLQEAIVKGLLPTPKIYLLPLSLDRENISENIRESWGSESKRVTLLVPFEKRFLYLNKKVWPASDLTIKCTPLQKYDYITNKLEFFKRSYMRSRQEFLKNKWLQFGSIRKRFLAELKTPILKQILKKLDSKRYICFCGSIKQATILDSECAIHSSISNPLKIIEKFNNKQIDHLITVNMLQEGQNLKDIEVGIIAQLDGQERAFIQKFGRTLRAEDPIQIILYYKDTRDEEYLYKVLEDINPEYICTLKDFSELQL